MKAIGRNRSSRALGSPVGPVAVDSQVHNAIGYRAQIQLLSEIAAKRVEQLIQRWRISNALTGKV